MPLTDTPPRRRVQERKPRLTATTETTVEEVMRSNPERLDRLIGTTVAHDQDNGRDTLVREFVSTFRGMARSSAQKAVLDTVGASRISLAILFKAGKQLDDQYFTQTLLPDYMTENGVHWRWIFSRRSAATFSSSKTRCCN